MATKQLVESVRFVELMKGLRPESSVVQRVITADGVQYVFALGKQGRLAVLLGVYPAEELAHAALERKTQLMMIGPTPVAERVGDELLVFGNPSMPTSGSVMFRRTNVMAIFSGDVTTVERLRLAKHIDDALQEESAEVKHTDNISPPKIAAVRLPAVVLRKETVEAEIEIENADAAALQFGSTSGGASFKTGHKPVLIYTAPAEQMEATFDIVAVTPGHLIVRRTVKVQVQ